MDLNRILSTPLPVAEASGEDDEEFVTISRKELEALKSGNLPATMASSVDQQSISEPLHQTDRTSLEGIGSKTDVNQQEAIKTAALERIYRTAILERELATALAERPLVAGSVGQLIKLWRDDLDVYEEDGTIKVSARDGRSVTEAVADWLSAPAFSHFCLASSKGGAGAKGLVASQRPSPSTSRSLGDEILRQWKEATPNPISSGGRPGWGRPR